MNQEKIGKFIAEKRKEKNLTQEQFAEKLGITKNAVSKWERGLGLMDMSLLKPISEILGITINELLAGENIKESDIIQISEKNIINLAELIDLKAMKYGIIGMAVFFIFLTFISMAKESSPAGLTSLICAYNAITFISKYKIKKSKEDLIAGTLFFVATICNTIAFIII